MPTPNEACQNEPEVAQYSFISISPNLFVF